MFNMGARVVEPASPRNNLRQGKLTIPVERECDPECDLEMENGLLRLVPGMIYIAETLGDLSLLAFLLEEINRAGCGFLCGVKLFDIMHQPSKVDQTLCLSHCATEPFEGF